MAISILTGASTFSPPAGEPTSLQRHLPEFNVAHLGAQIDLRITNLTTYYAWENNGRKNNGLKRSDSEGNTAGRFGSGGFGSVNLKGPRSPKQPGVYWKEIATYIELLYEFVTGAANEPIRLPRIYLSFYDFDTGTKRFESCVATPGPPTLKHEAHSTCMHPWLIARV